MDKILRDIKAIVKLSKKIIPELKKGDIRKAKKHLKVIIAFDLDELSRLQKEHGDRRVIDECLIVLKDARNALKDTNSFQRIEEARQLVEHIEKIEEWEYAHIRIRSHHVDKLQHYLENVKPFVFKLPDKEYIEHVRKITHGDYPDEAYNAGWWLNMREIFRRLREDHTLKIEYIIGPDSLCTMCGHRKYCIALNHAYHKKVMGEDIKAARKHKGLEKGQIYTVLEVYKKLGWLK